MFIHFPLYICTSGRYELAELAIDQALIQYLVSFDGMYTGEHLPLRDNRDSSIVTSGPALQFI